MRFNVILLLIKSWSQFLLLLRTSLHVLERGKPHERSQIIRKLSGHIVQLTQHKFALNVVEKCLDVLIKNAENTKKRGGKKVFSLVFLDPSSPRLASDSPEPPNSFMVKKPARLGKLIASALSFSLPRPATTAPK
ncbi:hypothetical protein JHK87_055947 [Glycine soja]|nr:hypothetical protein JHK87_055947 [Glycine soja]